jgi:hypothetical protein
MSRQTLMGSRHESARIVRLARLRCLSESQEFELHSRFQGVRSRVAVSRSAIGCIKRTPLHLEVTMSDPQQASSGRSAREFPHGGPSTITSGPGTMPVFGSKWGAKEAIVFERLSIKVMGRRCKAVGAAFADCLAREIPAQRAGRAVTGSVCLAIRSPSRSRFLQRSLSENSCWWYRRR